MSIVEYVPLFAAWAATGTVWAISDTPRLARYGTLCFCIVGTFAFLLA